MPSVVTTKYGLGCDLGGRTSTRTRSPSSVTIARELLEEMADKPDEHLRTQSEVEAEVAASDFIEDVMDAAREKRS